MGGKRETKEPMLVLEKRLRSLPAVSNWPHDLGGCGVQDVLWPNATPFSNQEPRKPGTPRLPSFCLQRDAVAPDQKTRGVEGFVEACAKAAQVSQVPDEAITTDTREPSHMFLAAEWNRSSVSKRAYLLAMLFGREFDVEANNLSLEVADLAMRIGPSDGSTALVTRVDLDAAPHDDVTRSMAAD